MDAIVTAGGIPLPEEPLYSETKGHNKALLDVAGKPMVQWVLDALCDAKTVENIIVVGLTVKAGLSCTKPVHFISNQGKMLDNFRTGTKKSLELNKKNKHVLFVSADIPAITGENGGSGCECRDADRQGCLLQCHPAGNNGKTLPGFAPDLYKAEIHGSLRRGHECRPLQNGRS